MFRTTQLWLRRGFLALTISFTAGCLLFEVSILRSSADCPPRWRQIGPSPVDVNPPDGADGMGPDSGLVRDIAIDPRGSSDQTIYVATDNGGIWKTSDGGDTWAPKTDFMLSLNMGAVALDPGNPSIVYAGTGNELNQGFFNGAGIYKSMDGGDTWTILGADILASHAVNRIVLTAPNMLLVASDVGVYRSVDGGVNFGNNVPLFNNRRPIIVGDVTDLDVDTVSATTVYASISGFGVFKSTDSGVTFPASGNLFTATNGAPTRIGYVAFAQSTLPDNRTIYANVTLLSGGASMFKSTNNGDNWNRIPTATNDLETTEPNKGYAQTIGVDPQDANRAFIGGRGLFMVTDGGAAGVTASNRIDLNKVHADQHALVFSPPSHRAGPAPTRFYNGTDGGIATNPDGGVNNWTLLNGSANCLGPNTSLATMLFRQIDIGRGSTLNNTYTYGVSQDLGISSHTPDCADTPWHLGVGGDGWAVAVDPNDPKHALAMAGSFFSTVDGKSWQAGTGLSTTTQPVYFDPNGQIVYALVNSKLFRSTNNGAIFSLMKTFPTPLTAINMVKRDSKTIWLGGSDGTVWHTNDANNGIGATWVKTSVPGAPNNQGASGIAVDPSNTSKGVVIYTPGRAFSTTNNGATWTDITGTLRNLRVNAVVIDPNTSPHAVIVATSTGVMLTTNGATWTVLGKGLPNVLCTSLAIDSTAVPSLLRVGTYGRSAFELSYDRKYVDSQNFGELDGSPEHPFRTVMQALNAPANGAARSISIQAGGYHESPLTIRQCTTLNALNGEAAIQ